MTTNYVIIIHGVGQPYLGSHKLPPGVRQKAARARLGLAVIGRDGTMSLPTGSFSESTRGTARTCAINYTTDVYNWKLKEENFVDLGQQGSTIFYGYDLGVSAGPEIQSMYRCGTAGNRALGEDTPVPVHFLGVNGEQLQFGKAMDRACYAAWYERYGAIRDPTETLLWLKSQTGNEWIERAIEALQQPKSARQKTAARYAIARAEAGVPPQFAPFVAEVRAFHRL